MCFKFVHLLPKNQLVYNNLYAKPNLVIFIINKLSLKVVQLSFNNLKSKYNNKLQNRCN